MNKLIIKIAALGIAIIAMLSSCEQDPTLQTYIVDSQEKSGFISTTVPKSILGIDDSQLSPESQQAYRSVDKVNVLLLPATNDKQAMIAEETEKLNRILNDEDYKLLMAHNSDGLKIKFLYQGDTENIDEMIAFGSMDKGMGVARIIGNDMNPMALMKMMKELENGNVDPAGITGMLKEMGVDTGDLKKGIEINVEDEEY